jgi:hypothetical protein
MKNTSAALALPKRLRHLSSTLTRWTERLHKHQTARLGVGLAFFLSLVPGSLTHEPTNEWFYPIPFLVLFVFLVIRTRNMHTFVQKLQRWQDFLKRQHLRSLGQASERAWKDASELSLPLPLVRDIGLTGPHSLWTLIDETLSDGGRRSLLHWMTSPTLDREVLQHRQNLIQRLQPQTWFYSRMTIDTTREDLNASSLQIQEFINTPAVEPSFYKILFINVGVWLATIAAALASDWTGTPLPGWALVIFPLISILSLSSASAAFRSGVGLAHNLAALVPLFGAIERRARHSKPMQEVCAKIFAASPSRSARRLDFIMNFVGTQTNPILHFILNAFVPWTVVSVFFFERLRKKISKDFPECLNELSEFEVLGSMLILTHYQTQTFPQLGSSTTLGPVLECQQIFHPLLDRAKAVANDFAFADGKTLGLLTGSNMSGKSTFLRTLGINQILANMGAPVFAKSMTTSPMKIETCIEVTDSLRDGYSYFYAEVRKLRHILTVGASHTPMLYLIDEIFRGTNNRERQLGSQAVIRTLAHENSAVGFISTHDLELTALEDTNPSVINLHFREDLDANGTMIFHYHLNRGPSPTTNALIIMKSEGIPVEL